MLVASVITNTALLAHSYSHLCGDAKAGGVAVVVDDAVVVVVGVAFFVEVEIEVVVVLALGWTGFFFFCDEKVTATRG